MSSLPKLKRRSQPSKQDIMYEMILEWSSPNKPFKLQKLNFKASASLKSAYKEAVKIKGLLQRVGCFKAKDIKLLAVGRAGVLRAHDTEHGLLALPHLQAMKDLVKKAQSMKIGKTAKIKPPQFFDKNLLKIRK